jgi:chitinase
LLIAAGMTVVAAAPAQAANLVTNPGFETGALAPWSCTGNLGSVVSSPVHTGTRSLLGAPNASDNAKCTQTVAVQPNTAYVLTGWFIGGGGYVYLGVTGGGSTWNPATASAWTQLSVNYTTAASQTSLQVYFHGWYGTGGYNADDISLDGPGGPPPPPVPGTPGTPVAGTITNTSIALSWTASTGTVSGYRVYEGSTVVATATGTSATVSGLAACTQHTYNVTAFNATGESAHSGNVTATTTGCTTGAPGTPGAPSVTGSTNTSISLAWGASTGTVSGYRVYEGTTVRASVTTTSATISGLTACTSHTYNVTAFNSNGESPHTTNVTGATTGCTNPGYAKVGYYPQWGIYGRAFWLKNLDASGNAARLTHLNYAFENINATTKQCFATTSPTSSNPQDPNQGDNAGDSTADYAWPVDAANSIDGIGDGGWGGAGPLKGNFHQLKLLKAKYPNLKVLVSLGGWTYSKYFSDAAATAAGRQALVSSCIDMYIKGNLPVHQGMGGPGTGANIFDGIDVDWEWPGAEGHPGNHFGPSDKANLNLLLQEFRTQLNAYGSQVGKTFLLTAFLPADPAKVSAGWDISSGGVFNYLDLGNVQGYDFHGAGSDNSWEPNRTGHQANLYVCSDDPYATHFSTDGAVQIYQNAGVNLRKLTIGFPFYGRGWQQVAAGPAGANGAWQTANGAAPGQFAEEAGTRGYGNLVSAVPGMTVFHNTQCVATYGYTGSGGQWWTFDDTWSIGQKTAYIKTKGLGGAMVWEMSGDTTSGTLMNAISTGLS